MLNGFPRTSSGYSIVKGIALRLECALIQTLLMRWLDGFQYYAQEIHAMSQRSYGLRGLIDSVRSHFVVESTLAGLQSLGNFPPC